MTKSLAVVLFILTWTNLFGSYLQVDLNGDWDFTFKKSTEADIPALPDASAYDIKLRVPDYMNFQSDRLSKAKWAKKTWEKQAYIGLRGIAFYRKIIDVPAEWENRSVQLYIGRAYDQTNVWVNGKHIAFCPYICFIPQIIDLSEYLLRGQKNEIIISVDNEKEMGHRFWRFGGIVEPVYLRVSNGIGRIEDVYIRAGRNLKQVNCQITLEIPFPGKLNATELKYQIREWNSGKLIGKGDIEVKTFNKKLLIDKSFNYETLKAWSPKHPNMYIFELSWLNGTRVIDKTVTRFGLRKWSSEGLVLKLNNKPVYLRMFFGYMGQSHYRYPQDKEYWLKFYTLIKRFGYNAADWEGGIASEENLAAADEAGIVVQTGYLFGSGNPRKYMVDSEANIKINMLCELFSQIVRGTRNHPSMSIYYQFAEQNYYDNFINDIRKLAAVIKKNNPESMFLPNQAMRGVEYSFLKEDKLTKNPFPHHAERLKLITECSDIFGQYPAGVFSYHPFGKDWKTVNADLAAVYKRPLISHEVMMSHSCGSPLPANLKYDALRKKSADLDGLCRVWGWPKAKSTLQATLKKQTPKNNVMYENSSRLNSIICKYVFEKLRKCNSIIGSQDIGAHAGLNSFLEIKPGFSQQKFRQYHSDNVILLNFDNNKCLKHCYWEGENFQSEVMASIYGVKDMEKGIVNWELKDNKKVLLRGEFKSPKITVGTISTLGNISFKWPEVKNTTQLTLAVKLNTIEEKLDNDWKFWVFKRIPHQKLQASCSYSPYRLLRRKYSGISYLPKDDSNKLWITENLTDKEIAHLEAGGDILLIGGKPFPLYNEWPHFLQGYRKNHTHGSIIKQHPVFETLPHDNWGDWQFYPVFEGAASVRFDKLPEIKFDPIIEFFVRGKQRNQTPMFEAKVGKGRLFVTTCRTNMGNPACASLVDSILKYVQSRDFKPETEIPVKLVQKLLNADAPESDSKSIKFKLSNFTGGRIFKNYRSFGIMPRDGICIEPGRKSTLSFNINKKQIPACPGKYFNLSCEGQDSDKAEITNIKITLNDHILYNGENKWIKKGWSTWVFPFEKEYLKDGVNTLQFKNPENLASPGHKWFMIAGIEITAPTQETARKFSGQDKEAPVLELVAEPGLKQLGGEYFGSRNTVFEIKAYDKLSGIKKIEIAIDSDIFKPYYGKFSLSSGLHTIKARCYDNAGNKTVIFTRGLVGGGATECIRLQLK